MQDQASSLRRMVSRFASAETHSRARQIVLTGCKGGVGTTTLAINLSIALRKVAGRVLLVDAAMHGDVATICGLRGTTDIDDMLAGRSTLSQATVAGPAGIQVVPRFGVSGNKPHADAQQLLTHIDAVRQNVDYIVLDAGSCPLTSEILWPNADVALVVTTTDTIAVTDAYVLIKTLSQAGASPPIGIVVNRIENAVLADDVAHRIVTSSERFLEQRVEPFGTIPYDSQLTAASETGRMVTCAYPASTSAVAISQISKRIASANVGSNDLNSLVTN